MLQALNIGLLVGGASIAIKSQNRTIFCFMIGVVSTSVLHNFLSPFCVAAKGYVAIFCPTK
jgi:hypothetical protein